MDTSAPRAEPLALPVATAFLVGLGSRVAMIEAGPYNFAFDAFQRWAGRDHVLVQAWLPLTQAIIAAVAALGGDLRASRLALALVAALATAAGGWVAGRLGGRVAAWAWLVPASFGPFLVWGGTLYQEGTFLLVLFAGLGLALSGRVRLADLVVGLLALVRYEGWPCVLLYVAWRRDPRALLAFWGAGLWLALKLGLDLRGYAASPVDFDDWEGLGARTTLATWLQDAGRLFVHAWNSGAVAYTVAALVAIRLGWRRRGLLLLTLIGLGQVAAVSGWLAGLEVATLRMLVVPAVIAGVLGAAGVGLVWPRLGGPVRFALVLYGLGMIAYGQRDAWLDVQAEGGRIGVERRLYRAMLARPDCDWRLTPRRELGTRSRHDGCEVVQGQGALRHGEGFWCTTWAPPPPPAKACVAEAAWNGEAYEIRYFLDGAPAKWGVAEPLRR